MNENTMIRRRPQALLVPSSVAKCFMLSQAGIHDGIHTGEQSAINYKLFITNYKYKIFKKAQILCSAATVRQPPLVGMHFYVTYLQPSTASKTFVS